MPLALSPRIHIVNSAGVPYPSAKCYTYRAGTTTALTTYTSATYGTPHANPVIADANGIFAPIYIDPALGYDLRMLFKDSSDVSISGWDIDNIPRADNSFPASSFSGNVTVTGNVTASGNVRAGANLEAYAAEPRIVMSETDRGTDLKIWDLDINAGVFSFRTRTDADGAGKNVLVVTRGSTTALSSIAIGNATDLPTITLNGTTLVAANIAQTTSSTFTGTLTGMTASTTGTIHYKKTGSHVTLHVPAAGSLTGTSNSVLCTLTGMPSTLYPAASQTVTCLVLDDANTVMGRANIAIDGTIYLRKLGVSGANITTDNDFTNSGTKGLPSGWAITFAL